MTPGCIVGLIFTMAMAAPLRPEASPLPEQGFTFGAAGRVAIYTPSGPPTAVVLFVSGDGGWNQGVVGMAQRLRGLGALVVGVDIRRFLHNLERAGSRCLYPAGDLEELSRAVQLQQKLAAYRPPILVGYSSGATLVYAALASAPAETFAGGISLGFCPDLEVRRPLCRGRALESRPRRSARGFDVAADPTLPVPWYVMQGDADQVCAAAATGTFAAAIPTARIVSLPSVGHGFSVPAHWEPQLVDAYRRLTARRELAAPSGPLDLPLVEVEAAPAAARDLMAVMLSGDGGWAGLDRELAAALAARGIPVVGWNSLRYFWSPRTPAGASSDLDRVLRRYLAAWGKRRALLVGYSFGADVLPFLASRLPEETKARVAGVALLGLGKEAAFEFHVSSWLGGGDDPRYPTVPEIRRLADLRVTCVQGADERDSVCRALRSPVRVITLPGGHHFGGGYARLAHELLVAVEEPLPSRGGP